MSEYTGVYAVTFEIEIAREKSAFILSEYGRYFSANNISIDDRQDPDVARYRELVRLRDQLLSMNTVEEVKEADKVFDLSSMCVDHNVTMSQQNTKLVFQKIEAVLSDKCDCGKTDLSTCKRNIVKNRKFLFRLFRHTLLFDSLSGHFFVVIGVFPDDVNG